MRSVRELGKAKWLSWISHSPVSLIYRCGLATLNFPAVIGCNLKNDRIISVHFQGNPFSITVIQVHAPTSNAEEVEVEWFYEDLQDLLELTHPKNVLFIIGYWNAKVGSQVPDKFGHGVQNEAEQRLIELCQENALIIANTLFQQHKRRLYTWTSPDGQH